MHSPLDAAALDQIFRTARTYRRSADAWLEKPVDDAQLRAAYDLARMGPTSANSQPGRIVFVRSVEAKQKLKRALSPSNVEQTMAAPATAIIGSDHAFYEALPRLYTEDASAKSWFEGKAEAIESTAFRNASLQGAYLIIALRALGLDCGPMSGFRNSVVDELFFAGTQVKSNFLINIGYGNHAVIVVTPVPALKRIDGVKLVPIGNGRALISLARTQSIPEFELGLGDALARAGVSKRDKQTLGAIADLLRQTRRSRQGTLGERKIIVFESKRRRRA